MFKLKPTKYDSDKTKRYCKRNNRQISESANLKQFSVHGDKVESLNESKVITERM